MAAATVLVTSSKSGFYAFVVPALFGALLIGLLRTGHRMAAAAPASAAAPAEPPLVT